MATFDPLAALEAEYAAVLAQSRSLPKEISPMQPGDVESACKESEDEESAAVEDWASYALLPSSPCTSDAGALNDQNVADREEDKSERPQSGSKAEELPFQREDVELQESKRVTIMRSMQQVKLCPPPWAQVANLTDEELVDMMQKQLGLMNKAE